MRFIVFELKRNIKEINLIVFIILSERLSFVVFVFSICYLIWYLWKERYKYSLVKFIVKRFIKYILILRKIKINYGRKVKSIVLLLYKVKKKKNMKYLKIMWWIVNSYDLY